MWEGHESCYHLNEVYQIILWVSLYLYLSFSILYLQYLCIVICGYLCIFISSGERSLRPVHWSDHTEDCPGQVPISSLLHHVNIMLLSNRIIKLLLGGDRVNGDLKCRFCEQYWQVFVLLERHVVLINRIFLQFKSALPDEQNPKPPSTFANKPINAIFILSLLSELPMKNKYMNIKLFTLHLILIREGLKEVGFLVYSKGKPSKTSCRIFSAKGVPPPPSLSGKSFCQKNLIGNGGYPPTPKR